MSEIKELLKDSFMIEGDENWIKGGNYTDELAEAEAEILKSYIKKSEVLEWIDIHLRKNVGILRQLLNEDRITDPKKMIDNGYIIEALSLSDLSKRITKYTVVADNSIKKDEKYTVSERIK